MFSSPIKALLHRGEQFHLGMGKEEGGNKLLHEFGVNREFEIGHLPGNIISLAKAFRGKKSNPRSGKGAVADKTDALSGDIRKRAQ